MPRSLFALLTFSIAWALYPWGFGCGPPPAPPKTGPRVSGIAPSEAKDAQEVYIEGRGFDAQPLTIKLIDSATAEEWPIEGSKIRRIEVNRVQVKLPDVGVQGRRLFYLRVNDNNVVNPAADRLFIRQNDSFRPPDQRISVQFIQWRPGWTCLYRSPPNDLEPVEPGPPYRCGCEQQPYLTERAVTRGLSSANPNDAWSATLWSDFENQWLDASREWSAMCSEAWAGAPLPAMVRDIKEELNQRVTLYSAPFYFLNLDPLFPYTAALAKRRHANQGVQVLVPDDFCLPRPGTDSVVPSDCTIWKPNKTSPLTVNVHIVGAFWDRNEAGVPEELDPATELHGIANPPSTFGNTEGMIVLSDNPSLGVRRRITNFGLCFGDHYAFASSPINVGFWQTERFTDAVPNLFAHELHHVLTGYVHPLLAPDPCHTIGVGTSTTACPRGFSMKMSPTQTVASECQRVIDGIPGIGDFTR